MPRSVGSAEEFASARCRRGEQQALRKFRQGGPPCQLHGRRKLFLQVLVTASLLLLRSPLVRCQNAPAGPAPGAPPGRHAARCPDAGGIRARAAGAGAESEFTGGRTARGGRTRARRGARAAQRVESRDGEIVVAPRDRLTLMLQCRRQRTLRERCSRTVADVSGSRFQASEQRSGSVDSRSV